MCNDHTSDERCCYSYLSYSSSRSYLPRLNAATLEDAARAEGEVVLYSSLNNEQIVTLVDAFKKKYPAIKPSFYRGTSERVLQRANHRSQSRPLRRRRRHFGGISSAVT